MRFDIRGMIVCVCVCARAYPSTVVYARQFFQIVISGSPSPPFPSFPFSLCAPSPPSVWSLSLPSPPHKVPYLLCPRSGEVGGTPADPPCKNIKCFHQAHQVKVSKFFPKTMPVLMMTILMLTVMIMTFCRPAAICREGHHHHKKIA